MDASGEVPKHMCHYVPHSGPQEQAQSSESHVSRDSEYWAAEALATDMDQSVSYCPNVMNEPIEDWLQENRPSILSRFVWEIPQHILFSHSLIVLLSFFLLSICSSTYLSILQI